MRKSLILVLVLLIIALPVPIVAHMQVNAERESVDITETTLRGSLDAAKGITIGYNVQYSNKLFWYTDIAIGDELETNTRFEFHQGGGHNRVTRGSYTPYGVHVTVPSFSIGMSGDDLLEYIEDSMADVLYLPILDVASRTPENETHTETVYVKDYYDYYPLTFDFDFSADNGTADYEAAQEKAAEIFKIPVRDDHRMTVTVSKYGDSVYEIETDSGDFYLYVESAGVVTEDGAYFILSVYDNYEAGRMESGGLPYGVYYLPFHQTEETVTYGTRTELVTMIEPEFENIATALELPEGQTAVDLRWDYEENSIMTVVMEEDACKLVTMNPDTHEKIQEFELLPAGDTQYWEMQVCEGYTLIYLQNGDFALLTEKSPGEFEIEFTGSLAEDETIWGYTYSELITAYDGERLVVAPSADSYWGGALNIYVSVYDDTGLIYAGQFAHSVDGDINSRSVRHSGDEPLTIKFN